MPSPPLVARFRTVPAFVALLVAATLAAMGWSAAPAHAVRAAPAVRGPVVLVGVAGLRWSDLGAESTPDLWSFAEPASVGSMSVRSVSSSTCPLDGWLTLGAGRRAEVRRPGQTDDATDRAPFCPGSPSVVSGPSTSREPIPAARVSDYGGFRSYNDGLSYDAHLGLLGEQLAGAGKCATAVGPGAAVALASSQGEVGRYLPDASRLTPETVTSCPLTVVDLGVVGDPAFAQPAGTGQAPRTAQVDALDARFSRLLTALPDDATVLVAGLSDSTRVAHLTAAVARGGPYGRGWLATDSTRHLGLVQLTDLTPTLTSLLGIDRDDRSVGSPIGSSAGRPQLARAARLLVSEDTAAQVLRQFIPVFFAVLILSQLVLYGAAAVALRRRWTAGASRRRVLTATRYVALTAAAVPAATFLAGAMPWWRVSHPLPALLGALIGCLALVTLVAALGPWRRYLLGPVTAVAAITALVLGYDVVSGSDLQRTSVMGYSPLVAGRFYGFGNIPFALFTAAGIVAISGAAWPLVRKGRLRLAGGVAAVAGAVSVALDGSPRWGSDFGGVLAIVPGYAVLAMGLAGIRITLRRLALTLLGGVVVVSAIAYADYRRPEAQRSHLGQFVAQVLAGEGAGVVRRKLDANLHVLTGNWLGVLVPFAIAFVVFVLMRPLQWRAAALERVYDRVPTFRWGLTAAMVALVVGFAVNDSGIAIPAVGLTVVIPLALAASVTALQLDEIEGVDPPRSGAAPATPTPEPRGPGSHRSTA